MKSIRQWKMCFVISAFLMLVTAVGLRAQTENGADKFRKAVNFEDNEFVGMYDVEIKHGIQLIEGTSPPAYERTELNYAVTYGIFTNYEITVDLPLKFHDNGPDDIGDMGVRQRVKFTEQETSFMDSSGGIEFILPTGNDSSSPPTGTDDLNFRLFGSMGHALTQNMEWLFNAGYTFHSGDAIDDRIEYNGAFVYQPTDRFKLNTEINGWTGGRPDNSELYLSPGMIFQPRSGFSLTVSLPIGLNSDAADHRGQIELIHEF